MGLFNAKENGINIAGLRVNLAAALAANAQVIYALPTTTGKVGNHTVVLKKLFFKDNNTGGQIVHIGTGVGAGFVDLIPPIVTINGIAGGWDEGELPEVETSSDITAYPEALGGGTIDIQAEVNLRG
jgi:hypothetical protein